MKKSIISILLAFVLMGCEDFLEYSEHSFFDNSEDIFDNYARTRQFLADIYSKLPDDFNSIQNDNNNDTKEGAMRSAACPLPAHIQNVPPGRYAQMLTVHRDTSGTSHVVLSFPGRAHVC